MRRLLTVTVIFLVMALLVLPTAMGRLFAGEGSVEVMLPDGSDALMISVFFPATAQIQEMVLGEYLKGVVAAEMPPQFADEALKAQFVVARTYAVRRMQIFTAPGKGGCSLNRAADVCADHNSSQAYMSREEVLRKHGSKAGASFWGRLDRLQQETQGLVLRYRGELIDPLYHSVSGRLTEDSGDYFVQSLPYLKSVDDKWGADSPKLLQTVELTLTELAEALSVNGGAVMVSALSRASQPVEIISRTATGRVKSVKAGGLILTGREFRERLGLQSSDFEVTVRQERVILKTHGYGHGVGMSQYGADGMARANHDFEEILLHYYTGIAIVPLFGE
jgi:stage II sporulation protein D